MCLKVVSRRGAVIRDQSRLLTQLQMGFKAAKDSICLGSHPALCYEETSLPQPQQPRKTSGQRAHSSIHNTAGIKMIVAYKGQLLEPLYLKPLRALFKRTNLLTQHY